MYNERLTDMLSVVGQINPASFGAGATSTAAIDMLNFDRCLFIVVAGVLGASATLDFEIDGDTASGGSFATKITGKSVTQFVKATDDTKIALIEVTAEEIAAQGFRYIKGKATVGTAASIYAVIALGGFPMFTPGGDYDLAAVKEII